MKTNNLKSLEEIYNRHSAPLNCGDGDKGTSHSYISHYYGKKFERLKNKKLKILEIGVARGLSLEMWGEYFSHSEIYGVEIEHIHYRPSNNRIKLIIGDATRSETFDQILNLDIIIDDGSHRLMDQVFSYMILFDKLNKGGLYIIEDVRQIDSTADTFKKLNNNVVIYDYRSIKNRADDVIVEIIK